MKFLLDGCASSLRLQDSLAAQGHDVLSALERNPRATDEELLALAMAEKRLCLSTTVDARPMEAVVAFRYPEAVSQTDDPAHHPAGSRAFLLHPHRG